jgi:HD-GYP domain-containing protein (c-di-GMP phosphodiesterase class II)
MGIADVFEALTAKDRPYKKPMKLSEALTILGHMKKDHHIDPDLFDVFIYEQIYLEYAIKYLSPEQIDNVDLSILPGYNPLQ